VAGNICRQPGIGRPGEDHEVFLRHDGRVRGYDQLAGVVPTAKSASTKQQSC
jgi:hypothetical protein